jgi:decaprenylphospho-beta-D-ribofuranose 2-oxidase
MMHVDSGWGRNFVSHMTLVDEYSDLLLSSENNRGVLAFGGRRSYGDSSLNTGGVSLSTKLLNSCEVDSTVGIAVCGSGLTMGELERIAIPLGWFPEVVPGTEFVTIGGAFASDIHGKSHHSVGTFSSNVRSIRLAKAGGGTVELFPTGEHSDEFWATAGGMGLTGIILEVTLKLRRIETSYISMKEVRTHSLAETLDCLLEFDSSCLYTVGWIDTSGKYLGRGIVSGGNHALLSELDPNRMKKTLEATLPAQFRIPFQQKTSFVTPATVRCFNAFWFRKPLTNGLVDIRKFMHPLDGVLNWNVIYGKSGFLQYQIIVPDPSEDFLLNLFSDLKSFGITSFLTVIKRFGGEGKGLLSFPKPGWTLSFDFALDTVGLDRMLDILDLQITRAGGRIYLTKDSRVDPMHLKEMYPRLEEWKVIRKSMDPKRMWQSDQSRRLGL